MKKLKLILVLILFMGIGSYAQSITVSGQVTEAVTNMPVSNHEVLITSTAISPTGGTVTTTASVFTDSSGMYSAVLSPMIVMGVSVMVSTADCMGVMQTQMLSMAPFVANFVICASSPPPCDASFYQYQDSVTPGLINFVDTSTGLPTSWSWNFGDGSSSSLQHPTHSYAQPGTYTVTLTIVAQNCTDTETMIITVGTPPCLAMFAYTSTPTSLVTFLFTDLSSGNPSTWLWDFGDGTTSTSQNPTHTYMQNGTYIVILTISGTNCTSSYTAIITVGAPPCNADFMYYPDSTGLQMFSFIDLSTGNITAWLWDFGDGTSSTLQNPVHAYNSVGTFVVTLTVSGPNCTDSYSMTITIGTPPCMASFFYTVDLSGQVYSFSDQSFGSPTSWLWNFGDGTTSTLQNPVHTYTQNGSYTVTLTISGPNCSSTETMTVLVGPPPCNADFYFYPDSFNMQQFYFVDMSTGSPSSWSWDFGDGGTSSLQNPSHTYAQPGSYSVTLTISGPTCVDSQTILITIGTLPCYASFTFTTTPGSMLAFMFTDTSVGNPSSWLWDFGDGTTSTSQNPIHTYSQSGTYIVTLVISGINCTSTSTAIVTAGSVFCNADFMFYPDSTGLPGYSFIDLSTGNITGWLWDFGDGSTSTLQNPTHVYNSGGTFLVTLTVSGPNCSDSFTLTITVGTPPCQAAFNYTVDLLTGQIYSFIDLSTGSPSSWLWDFGDGTTSTMQNPMHTYAQNGTYTVILTISGPNCTSTTTQLIVVGPASCDADFIFYTDSVNLLQFYFMDLSTGSPTSWMWNFGDGTTSTNQNPTHTYALAGTYTVTLSIFGPGCQDVEFMTVTAGSNVLTAAFSYTANPALAYTYLFQDMSTGNPIGWLWDFGDGGLSTDQNPSYSYTQPGTYVVTLGIVGAGTTSSYTDTIVVALAQTCIAQFSYTSSPVNPLILSFFDQSIGIPFAFVWDFGDGSSSTEQNPVHEYTTGGSYTVSMTATNVLGSDMITETVVVNGVNENIMLENQEQFQIVPNPNNGLFDLRISNPESDMQVHITNVQGQLIQTETLSNESGSESNIRIDLTPYSKGLYFVRLSGTDLNYYGKVIVR